MDEFVVVCMRIVISIFVLIPIGIIVLIPYTLIMFSNVVVDWMYRDYKRMNLWRSDYQKTTNNIMNHITWKNCTSKSINKI